ncbi:serine hydrolase domain-containing protein [Corynebacterium variabile]|uniref:serine hydrolase domain-containing protein n=2 Tax=Corynebacterium variabile TaxID=1727 RepID=UPI002648BBC2|nr:serine hydrolase domain-containing protein [Corynebacterium variabile]MDN6241138.1 beta-lactamase family protein [Corynebacterium variabile]MDN6677956.1 beta-lactamase family protein [Corynebacterium variabile]
MTASRSRVLATVIASLTVAALTVPTAVASPASGSLGSSLLPGSSSLTGSASADLSHTATAAQVSAILAEHNIPGAQVVHRVRDSTDSYSFGVASKETGTAVTDNTMFQAASLTKVVSAYAFLKMVDAGTLDLDTPLWDYYQSPRTAGSDEAKTITARMVLNHTTGLPNWATDAGDEESELVPSTTPGTEFGYSGDAFFLFQQTVEHMTGRDFADILQDDVFTPLGMDHSSLVYKDEDAPLMTVGHDADGTPGQLSKYTRGVDAYTLLTTGNDYTAFLQRAVNRGEGLSPEVHDEWLTASSDADQTPPSPADPYIDWGLGIGLEKNSLGDAAWHWGDNGTRRAFFITFPGRDESVAMFWNSENGQQSAAEILQLFFPGTEIHALEWVDGNPE